MNSRWARLCPVEDLRHLVELVGLLGQPAVYESVAPRYRPGEFQVVVREDGVWIHASLHRRFAKRLMMRFIADCDVMSDFAAERARRSHSESPTRYFAGCYLS